MREDLEESQNLLDQRSFKEALRWAMTLKLPKH
jgi:hypothetical protein